VPITRPRQRRPATALAESVVLLLAAGRGTSARERAEAIVDDIRAAVEEAKERSAAESGDVDQTDANPPPADGQVIRTDTRTAFDYDEYQATLETVISALQDYWGQALPANFQVEYSSPQRYVTTAPTSSRAPGAATRKHRRATPSTAPTGTSSPGTNPA